YLELAGSALGSGTAPPPGVEIEHSAAARALEESDHADKTYLSAGDSLLPVEPLERRRLLIGCSAAVAAVLLLVFLIVFVFPGARRVQTTALQGQPPPGITPLALAPGLDKAAGAGAGNSISVWSLPKGEVVATLEGHEQPVQVLDFGPRGKLLASAAPDRSVR